MRTNCPNCGAAYSPGACACEYCGTEREQEPGTRSRLMISASGVQIVTEEIGKMVARRPYLFDCAGSISGVIG